MSINAACVLLIVLHFVVAFFGQVAAAPLNAALTLLESRILPPEDRFSTEFYRAYLYFSLDSKSPIAFQLRADFAECTGSPQPPSVPVPLSSCQGAALISGETHVLDFPADSSSTVEFGFLLNLTKSVCCIFPERREQVQKIKTRVEPYGA
ncbi:MAG: hypothetical protein MHM6MM_002173 [Cercozoa sp. M6MM]